MADLEAPIEFNTTPLPPQPTPEEVRERRQAKFAQLTAEHKADQRLFPLKREGILSVLYQTLTGFAGFYHLALTDAQLSAIALGFTADAVAGLEANDDIELAFKPAGFDILLAEEAPVEADDEAVDHVDL